MNIERIKRNFLKRTIPGQSPNDCWKWVGAKNKDGYPKISVRISPEFRQITLTGNRLSFLLFRDYFDSSLQILHFCDNPECTNPAHLFVGNANDNVIDKIMKKRSWELLMTHCKSGRHLWIPENIHHSMERGKKVRQCRPCLIEYRKKSWLKIKAKRLESSRAGA